MKTMAVRRHLQNERGLATVETIPLLVLFVMLSGYALGLFGSIHTAILHSIAARTYAFETFRNRTNLNIFREQAFANQGNLLSYVGKGMRYHSVRSESVEPGREGFFASTRPLTKGYPGPEARGNEVDHMERIFTIQPRNEAVEVNPIWIMVGYGICLNAACGGR